MTIARSFDPIWEDSIYGQGQHFNRYPWDVVVSFVYRNAPRDRPRSEVRILEIGSGSGSNLWFAAREGFRVAGVDGSESAITYARERFAAEGLEGDLRTADFTSLPFDDESFDLVIDRCSLTCCGFEDAGRVVEEVHRVLAPGGRFLLNPYSDRHSSYASGRPAADGLRVDIRSGTLTGVGQIAFYGRQDIERLLEVGWRVLSLQHLQIDDLTEPHQIAHAEWRAIAEKAPG